jgi:sialic acid synthase SpsE/mannose-6-phosphate isomerase-like protein (cupin superfamily)
MDKSKIFLTLEMANNHMGSVAHGRRIIEKFAVVMKGRVRFEPAFKLQYRSLDTFIRPGFVGRTDLKHIKRFEETRLSKDDRCQLLACMREHGFKTMVTPFDEPSVDDLMSDKVDVVKVASCSLSDWLLHEKIAADTANLPIILSCAGADVELIDSVVTFYLNRKRDIVIQHCVGEYPTAVEDMQLNQIDFIKNRYPAVRFGFSSHELPSETDMGMMAIAKGASTLEKHVGLATDQWPLNAYSCGPDQFSSWLDAVEKGIQACGTPARERYKSKPEEASALLSLKRGVFARSEISSGDTLSADNVFFAFPPDDGQLTVASWSKYAKITVKRAISINAPISFSDVQIDNNRSLLLAIKEEIEELITRAGVATPRTYDLEISHHYGLERFHEFGLSIVTLVNREYCKKLLISLPNQKHPEQYHNQKEETFVVLYGSLELTLDGRTQKHETGDVITVGRGVRHAFVSPSGAVVEEISTTHISGDSFYSDSVIMANENRKSWVKVTK